MLPIIIVSEIAFLFYIMLFSSKIYKAKLNSDGVFTPFEFLVEPIQRLYNSVFVHMLKSMSLSILLSHFSRAL